MGLVRQAAKKADYLRYVAYEMGLEELRRKRAARLKAPKDHYGFVQRQYAVFERGLKKFKSDVGLWLEYVETAKREKATAMVGRILTRAVQVHPNDVRLWILLARHELETLDSVSGARTVLQRGLRMNGESDELWIAYIELEISIMEPGVVELVVRSAPERVRKLDMWADYIRD